MFFRIKRLTAEVFELELGEECAMCTLLLGPEEIALLRDVLKESSSLPVAKTAERWYNS